MKSKILIFIAILCALLSVVNSTVYLAPGGFPTWAGGSCDCGSEVSPCTVYSAVTATDIACSIFVYGGNYGSLTLQLTASSSALMIQAQTTSIVDLNINAVASTIQLDATISRIAWTGNFTLSSSSTTSTVTFSRLELTESTFTITSRAGVTLNDSSLTYTGTASNVITGVTYQWAKYELIDSTVTTPGKFAFWNSLAGMSDAVVTNSVITSCNTFFQGYRFNYINITSSRTNTTGNGLGSASGYGPAYVNVFYSDLFAAGASNRLFAGAIISRFTLYHSTVSKMNLITTAETGVVDWYNSTLTDTIMDGPSPKYRFQNISLLRSGSSSTYYGFRSGVNLDVDFTLRSLVYELQPPMIFESTSFSSTSNLTTSSIYFSKFNTIAGRWTHTGLILNELYDPTNVHSCNSMPTSIWTMGTTSMVPIFNMSLGGLLIFRSEGQPLGYINAVNGFYLPPTIQILWTPTYAPTVGTEYKLIYNATGDLPTQIPAEGKYQFDIYFKLESNNATKSLYYRYIPPPVDSPIDIPESTPFPPPPLDWNIIYGNLTGSYTVTTSTEVHGDVMLTSLSFGEGLPRLNVIGCFATSSVALILTQTQLNQILAGDSRVTSQQLVTAVSSCPGAIIGSIPSSIMKSGAASCRRVTSEAKQSPSGLSVLFRMNSMPCKTWWIALISVIGGCLLIVVIFILLYRYNKRFHLKVSPFTARETN